MISIAADTDTDTDTAHHGVVAALLPTHKWYDMIYVCVRVYILHNATSLAYLIIGYGYLFEHFIGFLFNIICSSSS